MKVKNRLQEALKQVQLAKEEVDRSDVSQELDQSLEALQNALESFEDD
ncbi:hypothetical protein [Haloarcula rubripromontorii]|uniref:Uncharacterized protein n=1 Tax=Haloarcula rubripromontorii TaxID=1705562 RepID=A0A847U969_9EURY|nr:hypothetical protein [Haloarcula rubripromontorii]NLV08010.1 hypothetical protein [Haloarcula rubripromontorii]